MKIERTRNAGRNIIWGVIEKIVSLLLPFVSRTILIKLLGAEYLGLNSLFTSILNVLSISELGFGTAIVFSIAMLAIILHHIHNRFGLHSPLLHPAGYLATGLFFFISGFGNELSLKNRKEVKADWVLKKASKIYVPFLAAYLLYYIVLTAFSSELRPIGTELVVDLFTISMPNQVSWFPKIILMCFLIHWIAKRIISHDLIQIIFLFCVFLIYMIVMRKVVQFDYWYNSVLCYPIGCCFAFFPQNIVRKRIKSTIVRLPICLAFCALILYLSNRAVVLHSACAILFSLICYYLSMMIKTKSKILSWIGNNSFEFYVFHVVCLQAFSSLIDSNKVLYTLLVFVETFVTVYVYKLIVSKQKLRD